MEDVLVCKSDDGEISIFDERDKFAASFRDGQWIGRRIFQALELEEFTIIQDENEVSQILKQAREALNQPLEMQADNQAKSA